MKIESLNDFPTVKKYLERVGAEPRTLLSAVVKEEGLNGYWRDLAVLKFSKKGEVDCPIGYEPNEDESEKIRIEFGSYDWPTCVFIPEHADNLPSLVKEADESNVFYFRDTKNNILMIQVRQDTKKGKRYYPITLWSDGEYRFLEPEGKLPLFGMENLKENTTCLVVEGAKCAKYVQWLIDAKTPEAKKAKEEHPWGDELSNMAVIGWTSGALSPSRCDWTPLNKHGITRAYICADNDSVGIAAIPDIAFQLRCVTNAIIFPEDFGASFDLYDPMPQAYYREINGKKFWVGPTMMELVHPATYLTDTLPPIGNEKKGKVVMRSHARHLWHFVEETKSFCYIEKPDIIRDAETLDAMMRPFSGVKKSSDLILESFSGRITSFDYCPHTTKRRVQVNGKSAINLYSPSSIKPQKGDAGPWLEFMEQLIPDEKERKLVLRWVATLSARPDIRMIYALLMVSDETGTGKSTFGRILQQLVGPHNCSMPSETAVAGEYNAWLVRRRLVVVNECYSGHSWKLFTKLKDLITEPSVSMRLMYKDPIDISNYAHFCLFSNSMSALKIDSKDRRIFAPRVTETRWPDEKWKEFHNWLSSGGYQIIAQWARDFGDYVTAGERAPMTANKQEMIDAARSKASVRAEELAGLLKDRNEPTALPDKEILTWLEAVTKERVYESLLEIRKLMKRHGVHEAKELGIDRISYSSQMNNLIINQKAFDILQQISDIGERKERIKSMIVRPSELMEYEGH